MTDVVDEAVDSFSSYCEIIQVCSGALHLQEEPSTNSYLQPVILVSRGTCTAAAPKIPSGPPISRRRARRPIDQPG